MAEPLLSWDKFYCEELGMTNTPDQADHRSIATVGQNETLASPQDQASTCHVHIEVPNLGDKHSFPWHLLSLSFKSGGWHGWWWQRWWWLWRWLWWWWWWWQWRRWWCQLMGWVDDNVIEWVGFEIDVEINERMVKLMMMLLNRRTWWCCWTGRTWMERRCEVTRTSCVKLAHTRTRGPCLIMSLFSRCVFFFQWLLEDTWYDQDKDIVLQAI